MRLLVGAVYSALHAAKQKRIDDFGCRQRFGFMRHLGVIRRSGFSSAREFETEGAERRTQIGEPICRRRIVHAIQALGLVLTDEVCGAHIGRKHALLNQTMRIVVVAFADGHDLLRLRIRYDFGFGRRKVRSSAATSGLKQRLKECVEIVDVGEVASAHQKVLHVAVERVPDTRIGKTRLGPNQCRIELICRHLALLRNDHVADKRTAIYSRIERTQAVTELLGQHRHHARREVHARATLLCIGVKRTFGRDVMTYVGNGDQKAPTAFAVIERRTPYRIVKVAGIFAVDRHETNISKINSLLDFLVAFDRIGQRLSLRLGLLGKFARNAEASKRHVDFALRGVDGADHASDRTGQRHNGGKRLAAGLVNLHREELLLKFLDSVLIQTIGKRRAAAFHSGRLCIVNGANGFTQCTANQNARCKPVVVVDICTVNNIPRQQTVVRIGTFNAFDNLVGILKTANLEFAGSIADQTHKIFLL